MCLGTVGTIQEAASQSENKVKIVLDFIVTGLDSHSVDECKSNQDLKMCMNYKNRSAQISSRYLPRCWYPWIQLFLTFKRHIKMLCSYSVPHSKTFKVFFLEPLIDTTNGSSVESITDCGLDGGFILAPGWGNRSSSSVLMHHHCCVNFYWAFIQLGSFGLQVTEISTQTAWCDPVVQ